MHSLLSDLRFTLRQVRKSPGFAFFAILVMALGIGANAAMFTVIRSVLLRPLPYHDPDRLVQVSGGATSVRFQEMKVAAQSYSGLGAFLDGFVENLTLSGGGEPQVLKGARVSANFP